MRWNRHSTTETLQAFTECQLYTEAHLRGCRGKQRVGWLGDPGRTWGGPGTPGGARFRPSSTFTSIRGARMELSAAENSPSPPQLCQAPLLPCPPPPCPVPPLA